MDVVSFLPIFVLSLTNVIDESAKVLNCVVPSTIVVGMALRILNLLSSCVVVVAIIVALLLSCSLDSSVVLLKSLVLFSAIKLVGLRVAVCADPVTTWMRSSFGTVTVDDWSIGIGLPIINVARHICQAKKKQINSTFSMTFLMMA